MLKGPCQPCFSLSLAVSKAASAFGCRKLRDSSAAFFGTPSRRSLGLGDDHACLKTVIGAHEPLTSAVR